MIFMAALPDAGLLLGVRKAQGNLLSTVYIMDYIGLYRDYIGFYSDSIGLYRDYPGIIRLL